MSFYYKVPSFFLDKFKSSLIYLVNFKSINWSNFFYFHSIRLVLSNLVQPFDFHSFRRYMFLVDLLRSTDDFLFPPFMVVNANYRNRGRVFLLIFDYGYPILFKKHNMKNVFILFSYEIRIFFQTNFSYFFYLKELFSFAIPSFYFRFFSREHLPSDFYFDFSLTYNILAFRALNLKRLKGVFSRESVFKLFVLLYFF